MKDEEGELYLRRLGATAVAAEFVNRRMAAAGAGSPLRRQAALAALRPPTGG